MAAHRAAIAIQSLAFLPAHGFQAAAASVAGRLLGAGQTEPAMRSAIRSSFLALVSIIPVFLLLFFIPDKLMSVFKLEDSTAQLAAIVL